MKEEEIEFSKYVTKGADYHYQQINKSNFRTFNAFIDAKYRIEISVIEKTIELLKKRNQSIKVLDVGCGDGVLFHMMKKKLKNKNIKIFGIDKSEKALEIALKKNPDGEFQVADLYELPFEDDFFDLVLSSDVIEHVLEPNKMLLEIRRVGKHNSFTIIGTPIKYTEDSLDALHVYEYFPKEFENLLQDYFKVIKTIKSLPLHYFYLYNHSKNISIFRQVINPFRELINFFSILLKKNPFLKISGNENYMYSYMYSVGKILK